MEGWKPLPTLVQTMKSVPDPRSRINESSQPIVSCKGQSRSRQKQSWHKPMEAEDSNKVPSSHSCTEPRGTENPNRHPQMGVGSSKLLSPLLQESRMSRHRGTPTARATTEGHCSPLRQARTGKSSRDMGRLLRGYKERASSQSHITPQEQKNQQLKRPLLPSPTVLARSWQEREASAQLLHGTTARNVKNSTSSHSSTHHPCLLYLSPPGPRLPIAPSCLHSAAFNPFPSPQLTGCMAPDHPGVGWGKQQVLLTDPMLGLEAQVQGLRGSTGLVSAEQRQRERLVYAAQPRLPHQPLLSPAGIREQQGKLFML